ncbi:hypothetical protein TELCIR_07027 [Teladorsagia circumcincta]|uniref:Uncharacterized protein n=1 Tax=Teladorsagia circumcincta TaxID=45464 RepID=A0A2G9ULQ0_TELCI|nr:hypothetical protein TELCIR_07027 [Teladorsagia circumcincta]
MVSSASVTFMLALTETTTAVILGRFTSDQFLLKSH